MPHGSADALMGHGMAWHGMAGSHRPYEHDQMLLLSAGPQDWLPAGHLAHFLALALHAIFTLACSLCSAKRQLHPSDSV